jgi:hypothetical protein
VVDDLAPSPPPPDPYREGLSGPFGAAKKYTCNKWRTWLICGETVIHARRLERFSVIKINDKTVTGRDPNEPNRRIYGWPRGPRMVQWQLWGWDQRTNLLLLLSNNTSELGEAIAYSDHMGVPITITSYEYEEHREYFTNVAVLVHCVRAIPLQLRTEGWVADYLTDGIVWVPEGGENDVTADTEPPEGVAPAPSGAPAEAMLLAIAQTEARWTDRVPSYVVNPELDEGDIPNVVTCPPWWKRCLVHACLGWPGRIAMWYLTMWYAPNLFWSAVIFTPFIQWSYRIYRRLRWRKTHRKLFEARTTIMVAQTELTARMGLYQVISGELPIDESKAQRAKILAEQNALTVASQALAVAERNFYIRHPVYARFGAILMGRG